MLIVDIFHKIYPVFLAGLGFGAGLPILYALGVRLMSGTAVETPEGAVYTEPAPAARAAAYVLFAVLALAVVSGILWIAKDFIYAYTGFNFLGTAG
ncbi:hypothetical protein [Rothia nasimurium]|uniref:hypothetical protein n=1 Tax=Rothia nasimurium TaxID=85336 RepID=UPI001F3297AC|nr:hypothetical protein [Rothia nasimurium]